MVVSLMPNVPTTDVVASLVQRGAIQVNLIDTGSDGVKYLFVLGLSHDEVVSVKGVDKAGESLKELR